MKGTNRSPFRDSRRLQSRAILRRQTTPGRRAETPQERRERLRRLAAGS